MMLAAQRHYGPGPHPGTGSPQSDHDGGQGAAPDAAKLTAAAKAMFGVTDDLREAGYITPDGTMLDFTGRHYASGYHREGDRFVPDKGKDWLAGTRSVDHREVHDLLPDVVVGASGDERMMALLNAGFVRNSTYTDVGLNIHRPFSPMQLSVLSRAIQGFPAVTVDITDSTGYRTIAVVSNWDDPRKSNGRVLREAQEAAIAAASRDATTAEVAEWRSALALAVRLERAGRPTTTKLRLALLEPDADDAVIDGFLAALGVRTERAADPDDHFYGAWSGGSKKEGGHPGTGGKDGHATGGKATPTAVLGAATQGVDAFERGILGKVPKVEYGQVWDKDGNQIYAAPVKGTRSRVRWQHDANTQERWRGGTLSHFHPDDTSAGSVSLSEQDVATALDTGLGVIRAFGPGGQTMTLVNRSYPYNSMVWKMAFRSAWGPQEARYRAARPADEVEYLVLAADFAADYRKTIIATLGKLKGLEVVTTP